MMLARVLLKKGCIVPEHSHHNEQITYILEGALKFWIDGKVIVVNAGAYLEAKVSSSITAMFAGGLIRWLIERRAQTGQRSIAEVESGPGVLFSSGLIAGGAICGIVLAAIAGVLGSADALAEKVAIFHALGSLAQSSLIAYVLFGALGVLLYRIALRPQ